MLQKILEENGFSPKEAKIYLSGLELGSAPASSIARHAKENRVTVYTILKDLCKRGIVLETVKNNVKCYKTISPQILIKTIQEQVQQLEKIIPELKIIVDPNLNQNILLPKVLKKKKQKLTSNKQPDIKQGGLFDI